jgi:hypothetical protein
MSRIELETAERFSQKGSKLGFLLDFSIESLKVEVDRVLNSTEICFGGIKHECWENQSGLEAYVGEALLRLYGGEWQGQFNSKNPGANFYFSFVKFDTYKFFPSRFLGYRISNGEENEGSFSNYLPILQNKISGNIS